MEVICGMLTNRNVVLTVISLQLVVAVLVLFLLHRKLERELFLSATEQLSAISSTEIGVDVVIVTARKLADEQERRLLLLVGSRFPKAALVRGQDTSLWGGIIVRAGGKIIDCSLSETIKQVFKTSNT